MYLVCRCCHSPVCVLADVGSTLQGGLWDAAGVLDWASGLQGGSSSSSSSSSSGDGGQQQQ